MIYQVEATMSFFYLVQRLFMNYLKYEIILKYENKMNF